MTGLHRTSIVAVCLLGMLGADFSMVADARSAVQEETQEDRPEAQDSTEQFVNFNDRMEKTNGEFRHLLNELTRRREKLKSSNDDLKVKLNSYQDKAKSKVLFDLQSRLDERKNRSDDVDGKIILTRQGVEEREQQSQAERSSCKTSRLFYQWSPRGGCVGGKRVDALRGADLKAAAQRGQRSEEP